MLRPLEGIENVFSNKLANELIEFAIKFDDAKHIPKVVKNLKKLFIGLRLKVIDQHYYEKQEESLLKLPNWIQDCKTACDWIYQNHSLPIDKGLATIAANDRIVVINSSHNTSDSGFILKAIKHCLDDDIGNLENFKYPMPESVAFKNEIARAEKNNPHITPMKELTSFLYDKNDPHFSTDPPVKMNIDDCIPVEKLTCYDSKLKRPKGLTELIWTAITMSVSAMGYKDFGEQDLGLPIIIDTRKFSDDPTKLNWSLTQAVSAAHIKMKPREEHNISDIGKELRRDLERIGKDGYYHWINHGNFSGIPYHGYGMSSSIGAVEIKHPMIDFFIQSRIKMSKDLKISPESPFGLNVFSFSKVTPSKNLFYPTVSYLTSSDLQKSVQVLHDSFIHFITEIPLDTKYKEALKELRNFQQKLLDEY